MERWTYALVIFGVLFRLSSTDKVPVLIWSNDRSLTLPHPLSGHTIGTDDFAKQYLHKLIQDGRRNVVLFVQDKLSLCDISRSSAVYGTDADEAHDALKMVKEFMSSMSVAQLPSVDNPMAAIADLKAHFSAESIRELQAPYDIDALSPDPAGHNLIVVKLPETPMGDSAYQKSLQNVDKIIETVTAQLEKLSAQYVAVYTASKSTNEEFYSAKKLDASHSGRQLLEVTAATSNASALAYVNGTFLFYVGNNLTVQVNGTPYYYQTGGDAWRTTGCTNSSDQCEISMTYLLQDSPQVTLTMTLMKTTKSNSGFWYIGDFRVAVSNQEAQMRTSFVDLTPLGYSYHCYPKTNISAVNGSSIYVVFNNYQIQGYNVGSDGRFGHYNDCVGFFTVPIWMGVLSSFVLIAILLFGVIMLMDVKTMDRFDDPKGKTITITATD